MNGLDKMNLRLAYRGGDAKSRLQKDKLNSLKRALLYSYQSATVITREDKEYRCLINPNKNTDEFDDKILSVPFEDIGWKDCCCKKNIDSRQGSIEEGDIITWKETDTKWIVYKRFLEETAYFRAAIRRCTNVIVLDNVKYWVALINNSSIAFEDKASVKVNTAWNNPNAAVSFIIPKDRRTLAHIHRYSKIKIYEESMEIKKTWKVININESFGDGVIQVFLEEDYENSLLPEEPQQSIINEGDFYEPFIKGLKKVTPFNRYRYKVENCSGGAWYVQYGDKEKQQVRLNSETVELYINKTKDREFTIFFESEELDKPLTLTVDIDTF